MHRFDNGFQHTRPPASASDAARWLLAGAMLLAVCLLTSFVLLLQQSIHRGEALREQQRAEAQAAFQRATPARSRSKERLLLATTDL